jgi:hypothetical protein
VGKAAEREVGQAVVLGLADAVLDAGVPAVVKVKLGDVAAFLVGEEHREARRRGRLAPIAVGADGSFLLCVSGRSSPGSCRRRRLTAAAIGLPVRQ